MSEPEVNAPNESPVVSSTPIESLTISSTPVTPCDNTQTSPQKKLQLTSTVWSDFDRKEVEGSTIVVCKHCKLSLHAETKNGTTHLHNHLKRCPKRKNLVIRQQLFATSARVSDGKVQFGAFTFDQEYSRKELASAIVLHEYPLSFIDHVGIRSFIKSLQPLFEVVTHNTIKSDILKLYQVEKIKMYSFLENLYSRVALTTDMWTSNQKKGYMAVTALFIDSTWVLQSRILSFIYVPTPHMKEVLSSTLMECILDWNIDRKISTITVDNYSTNNGMIDILVDKFASTGSLLIDRKILHVRCAAHILNLIVKDGLAAIEEAIEKIQNSVCFWTATPSRVEKFEEELRQLCITNDRKLFLDCKTRWNSTYLMLENAILSISNLH